MHDTVEALRRHARLAPMMAAVLLTVACKSGPVQEAPAPAPDSVVELVPPGNPEDSRQPTAGSTPATLHTPQPAAPSPNLPTQAESPAIAPTPTSTTDRDEAAATRAGQPGRIAESTPTRNDADTPKTPRAPAVPAPTLRVTDHDPIHDPASPAYRKLQKPSEALREMPLDRAGRVNWVQALRQGLVAPRANLGGPGQIEVLDLDILMTDTRSMPHVLFPHRAHTEWLSCDSCHPKPFIARADANPINMDAIFLGRYCGVCHDKVAFSSFVCERCHSVPHAGSPAKWW